MSKDDDEIKPLELEELPKGTQTEDGYWGYFELWAEVQAEAERNKPKCTCGADTTYGKDRSEGWKNYHAEYCDLIKRRY